MRTLLAFSAALLLVLIPSGAFAAFNDVNLAGDTVFSVGGITININASNNYLSSISVGPSSFTVTLLAGSSIELSAPNRNQMTTSGTEGTYSEVNACNSSVSLLSITSATTTSTDVVVTPSSTICGSGGSSSSSSSSSSGGGSGGIVGSYGGSGGSPAVAPTVPTATTPVSAVQQPLTAPQITNPTGVSALFDRTLTMGASGEDVMRLQKLLNTDPATQIASSGIGSPGYETTLFGSLTLAAVQKFQMKYAIAGPGSTGYGVVGPNTRAKLLALFGAQTSSPAPAASSAGSLTVTLRRGMSHAQVKLLQQILNTDADTMVAATGPGSVGNETMLFGALTEMAVQKFQAKYGIVSSGTPNTTGYGLVGSRTRAKLNSL